MLDAAFKALAQLFSPPFRTVLLKSIGLALVLLIAIGVGLGRLLAWLIGAGGVWLDTAVGPIAHGPVNVLEWLLAIMAGLGIIAGAVFLMPAVTSLVAGFFADEIAEEVERDHYPADPPGTPVPIGRALIEGVNAALLTLIVYLIALPFLLVAGFFADEIAEEVERAHYSADPPGMPVPIGRALVEGVKAALLTLVVYLVALPFLLAAGLGLFIFFFANAFLLGRIYFELAAMRFHPVGEAKHLRKMNQGKVFVGGLFIAAFVSIPIVNLATPLFGTAFMVHLHKRICGMRADLRA